MTDTRPRVHEGHPGWFKNCQHADCKAHTARYLKRWAYERSHGLLRMADAAGARKHVFILIGQGWSLRAIAGAADISPTTVMRVRDGQGTVQKGVLAAILGIDPRQVPFKPSNQTGEPFVPRIGTVRRLQALIFMGWTHKEISKRIGMRSAVLLNQQGRWVTRTSHDRVAGVYAQISMTPGPSNHSRGWARKLGYVGPLSWEDIDLDAEPLEHPVDFTEETTLQTVARLIEEGLRPGEIARMTGITPDTVSRTRAVLRERGVDLHQEIDEVAVQRRMAGDRTVAVTIAERREAMRRLHESGLNDVQIADRIGFSLHTIGKDRDRLGIAAVGQITREAS